MTSSVKVLPVLHENVETKGIIATDTFNLNVEVPNEYKIWLSTPQTNISTAGVSFQSVNTDRFMDSNVRLDLTFKLVFSGLTWGPTAATANPPEFTPPYFWSQASCGVDAFALNKLINRIGFNIQNKQWNE